MNKKLLIKYLIMYIPFVLGIGLFVGGVINLFSSLLLFLGGYIAFRNTLDYRLIKKNINSVKPVGDISNNDLNNSEVTKVMGESKNIKPMISENIVGFKRTRRYSKVRRKY